MKKRVQVTLNPVLLSRADPVMAARGFDSLSEFIESLLRDELERRGPLGNTAAPAVATFPAGSKPAATDRLNDPVTAPPTVPPAARVRYNRPRA